MNRRNAPRGLLEVGDHVRTQDPITKKWTKKGLVKEKVIDTDGSVSSFVVEADESYCIGIEDSCRGLTMKMNSAMSAFSEI